jgi:hypothetical protein
VVDVTLSRGKGVTTDGDQIADQPGHLAAVKVLETALLPYRNAYIDLANERDVHDARYVSFEDLSELRDAVKAIDPERLVTASGLGDLAPYFEVARLDFICPHLPRHEGTAADTEDATRRLHAEMEQLGHVVPIHYQEPFRRAYGAWMPTAADFLQDLRGAVLGGAAGWCLHNGNSRGGAAEGPTRSFWMNEAHGRLMDQLDAEEREVLARMAGVVAEAEEGLAAP